MNFTGTIWRPPYEAWSALLQVTAGCTHHKCKFCTLYEDLPFKFRMSSIEEIENDLKELSLLSPNALRIFLTGGNPFALSTDKLKDIAYRSKQYLPKLDTFGCFARITDISSKSITELKELRAIGFNRITIGAETGDNDALIFMNKGYSSNDILIQCRKLEEANIDYNFFYLAGIHGKGRSKKGVENTVKVFNQLHPKIIGASMLTVFETSKLFREIQLGIWQEESEYEKLNEVKMLIESLKINAHFAALGSSNAFNFQGNLPKEKQNLINYIDNILSSCSENQLKNYRNNLESL